MATGTRKSTEEDKARIKELMGDNALMLEDGNRPQSAGCGLSIPRADLMIAGGRNMFTAIQSALLFLDINQEREHAYAGYEGMVELATSDLPPRWKARFGRTETTRRKQRAPARQ